MSLEGQLFAYALGKALAVGGAVVGAGGAVVETGALVGIKHLKPGSIPEHDTARKVLKCVLIGTALASAVVVTVGTSGAASLGLWYFVYEAGLATAVTADTLSVIAFWATAGANIVTHAAAFHWALN